MQNKSTGMKEDQGFRVNSADREQREGRDIEGPEGGVPEAAERREDHIVEEEGEGYGNRLFPADASLQQDRDHRRHADIGQDDKKKQHQTAKQRRNCKPKAEPGVDHIDPSEKQDPQRHSR
jgi:hypothetical protein